MTTRYPAASAASISSIALCLTLFFGMPAQADERREAGAHEHGHSTLNIAIEGSVVTMELIAPGADIVGFEHAAKTETDKAAIATAKTALSDALALFILPRAAECRLASATVDIESAGHHDHNHSATAKTTDEEDDHAEFHVDYVLDCAKPEALTAIDFAYFQRFTDAEDIDVTVVTNRGQSAYEITRAAPRLSLRGRR